MSVTLMDVAKRCGVSAATVSRVLNNKMVMPIPAETVARIKRAAAELEYMPNLQARALATGKTYTLGVYSAEMNDPHFVLMQEAMEAKAAELGYHLIVSRNLDAVTRKGRVDGSIVLGSPGEPGLATLSRHVATAFVYNAPELRPNLVGWSDAEGMGLAVRHLAELGHRQLAALFCYGEERQTPPGQPVAFAGSGPGNAAPMLHPKVSGFRDAVQRAGIEATECWEAVFPDRIAGGNQIENGYQAVQRLLHRGIAFTGIVARNDFLALGALRALRQARLSVPEEVSVIGYTDSIQALCADPQLTSVRTPIAEAGELAVEALVKSIVEEDAHLPGTLLPTSLTVRRSCAPPRPRTL